MNNWWLKIKIWTKVAVFGVVGLYVIVFLLKNWDAKVEPAVYFPFVHNYDHPQLLTVLLITAVVSIFGSWLIRTIFRTIRQVRDLRARGRTAKLEKEMAEMKAKAGMLQTKEPGAAAPLTPGPPPAADEADA